jgi:hypothetical protein
MWPFTCREKVQSCPSFFALPALRLRSHKEVQRRKRKRRQNEARLGFVLAQSYVAVQQSSREGVKFGFASPAVAVS